MYRKTAKQKQRWREAKERKRMEADSPDYPRELPELRKVIVVVDYDRDPPEINTLHQKKSDRVDCYNVEVNGKPWKQRIGMSQILAGVRKSLPRSHAV